MLTAFSAWNETDHPRGQPANKGEFKSKNSGAESAPTPAESLAKAAEAPEPSPAVNTPEVQDVLKLIRKRKILETIIRSWPDADAVAGGAVARARAEKLAPLRKQLAELDKQIGERPSMPSTPRYTATENRIKRQYRDVKATRAMFGTDPMELVGNVFVRGSYAFLPEVGDWCNFESDDYAMFESGEERWITIGAKPGADGKRHGGTPVQIDSSGNIEKGPKALAGQNVANVQAPAAAKPAAAGKPTPRLQKSNMMLHKNTRPNEGPWRVTHFYPDNDYWKQQGKAGRVAYHQHFPDHESAAGYLGLSGNAQDPITDMDAEAEKQRQARLAASPPPAPLPPSAADPPNQEPQPFQPVKPKREEIAPQIDAARAANGQEPLAAAGPEGQPPAIDSMEALRARIAELKSGGKRTDLAVAQARKEMNAPKPPAAAKPGTMLWDDTDPVASRAEGRQRPHKILGKRAGELMTSDPKMTVDQAVESAAKELKAGKAPQPSAATPAAAPAGDSPAPTQAEPQNDKDAANGAAKPHKMPPKDKPVTLMFGGSFSPVHKGHVQAAKDARAHLESQGYKVGRTVFAPSPDALLQKKLGEHAIPHEDRAAMIQKTIADEDGMEVATEPGTEKPEGGKYRRTQLADWARKEHADSTVVNLTGADAAPDGHPGLNDPVVYTGTGNHDGYHYLTMPRPEDGSGPSSSKVRKAYADSGKVPEDLMHPDAAAHYHEHMQKRKGEVAAPSDIHKESAKAPDAKLNEQGAATSPAPKDEPPVVQPATKGDRAGEAIPPAPTADTGVFGQEILRPATGSNQGGLFHEPVNADRPTEEPVGSKSANDPKNTAEMFPAATSYPSKRGDHFELGGKRGQILDDEVPEGANGMKVNLDGQEQYISAADLKKTKKIDAPTDDARTNDVARMDAALGRMKESSGENEHYQNLKSKRDAVASGKDYKINDVTEDTVKEAGRAFGKNAAIPASMTAGDKSPVESLKEKMAEKKKPAHEMSQWQYLQQHKSLPQYEKASNSIGKKRKGESEVDILKRVNDEHHGKVLDAIRSGKDVPREVLSEYKNSPHIQAALSERMAKKYNTPAHDKMWSDAAEKMLGRRPDRIVQRGGAQVKFAWKPGNDLDPLNISDWYHPVSLGIEPHEFENAGKESPAEAPKPDAPAATAEAPKAEAPAPEAPKNPMDALKARMAENRAKKNERGESLLSPEDRADIAQKKSAQRKAMQEMTGSGPHLLHQPGDDRSRGVVIAPSAREKGRFQATHYDVDGFVRHTTHDSVKDAIRQKMSEGLRPGAPADHLDKLSKTERFRTGNDKTRVIGYMNELRGDKANAIHEAYKTGGLAAATKAYQDAKAPAAESKPAPKDHGSLGIGGAPMDIDWTQDKVDLHDAVKKATAGGPNRAEVTKLLGEENAQRYIQGRAGGQNHTEAITRAMRWGEKSEAPKAESKPAEVKAMESEAAKAPSAAPNDSDPTKVKHEPGSVKSMPLEHLHVDPERFQYKGNVDKTGVTNKLKNVKYDPELSGIMGVWQDPEDGKTYVVNGHHRHELAHRHGVKEVAVRFLKAKTAAEARTTGALINIAQGNGRGVDAAKLFRESGMSLDDLKSRGVSLTSGLASTGLNLAKLHPDLFSKVVKGEISEPRGAAIGEAFEDHAQQKALVDMLGRQEKRGRAVSNEEIGDLSRFIRSAGVSEEKGGGLFADDVVRKSNAMEKARLSTWFKRQIRRNKKLFGTIANKRNVAALTEAGNQIDADKAKNIADDASAAEFVFDKLVDSKGAISSILNEHADQLAKEGANFENISKQLHKRLSEALPEALKGNNANAG